MVRTELYYQRKTKGVCVDCESRVNQFARCRRCLMAAYRERNRKLRYARDSL